MAPPSGSAKSDGSNGMSRRRTLTMTPAQLDRKRAKDREAQRTFRSRTKERIERLEKELEDLRDQRSRDGQELERCKKALEEVLQSLTQHLSVDKTTASGAIGGTLLRRSLCASTPGTASPVATYAATSSMEVDVISTLARPVPCLDRPCYPVHDCPTRRYPSPGPGSDDFPPDHGASSFGHPRDNGSRTDSGDPPQLSSAYPLTVASQNAADGAHFRHTVLPTSMIPSAPADVKMEFGDGDQGTLLTPGGSLCNQALGDSSGLKEIDCDHQPPGNYEVTMPTHSRNNADGSSWPPVLRNPSSSPDDYTTAEMSWWFRGTNCQHHLNNDPSQLQLPQQHQQQHVVPWSSSAQHAVDRAPTCSAFSDKSQFNGLAPAPAQRPPAVSGLPVMASADPCGSLAQSNVQMPHTPDEFLHVCSTDLRQVDWPRQSLVIESDR